MGDFFIAPGVSANYGDAEDLGLRRLNQHGDRLHVAAAGSGAVFVDDDLAAGLRDAERGRERQHEDDGF